MPRQREAPRGSGCQGCSAHLSKSSLSGVHRDSSLRSPALPAQPATVWCLHSCGGDAVLQLQGDWKPRNAGCLLEAGKSSGISARSGGVWFVVQIQACIYLVHDFSTTFLCLACTNYLVGLGLCTRQKWGILFPKKRARKYGYYILISYGHLVLLLHHAGSKHRGNSSLWVKNYKYSHCYSKLG